jgi:hypothetical protein
MAWQFPRVSAHGLSVSVVSSNVLFDLHRWSRPALDTVWLAWVSSWTCLLGLSEASHDPLTATMDLAFYKDEVLATLTSICISPQSLASCHG